MAQAVPMHAAPMAHAVPMQTAVMAQAVPIEQAAPDPATPQHAHGNYSLNRFIAEWKEQSTGTKFCVVFLLLLMIVAGFFFFWRFFVQNCGCPEERDRSDSTSDRTIKTCEKHFTHALWLCLLPVSLTARDSTPASAGECTGDAFSCSWTCGVNTNPLATKTCYQNGEAVSCGAP